MRNCLLLLLALFTGQLLSAQRTIIYCGHLLDPASGTVSADMSILVEGRDVIGISKGFMPAASGDSIINLKRLTVMPGLIDCHVHMEQETGRGAQLNRFTQNPEDIAFEAARIAKVTLMAGFTTVRDLGGSGVNIALRNAINRGLVMGPRIFTAGKTIASTGGHADPTNGYKRSIMGDPGPVEGVANGPDECRKAVRQRYKEGSDVIKITASGGVLSLEKDGSGPQFSEAEIRAIVETAADYGMSVAAHAHGAEAIKRAVRAGVTSIEHGTLMDAEGMELCKQHGTWLVPTIIAGISASDSARRPGYFPAIIAGKALAIGPKIQATFGRAYKAGVKIAFGTDAGVYAHGKNWMEFIYMHQAGMPVMEALKSATVNGSQLLGMQDKIGTIEKGKFADIIAVDGDPVADLEAMGRVKFVMKEGVVYKQF